MWLAPTQVVRYGLESGADMSFVVIGPGAMLWLVNLWR
jgi:hypothetical protein